MVAACGLCFPNQGSNPRPPALGARCLSQWATREALPFSPQSPRCPLRKDLLLLDDKEQISEGARCQVPEYLMRCGFDDRSWLFPAKWKPGHSFFQRLCRLCDAQALSILPSALVTLLASGSLAFGSQGGCLSSRSQAFTPQRPKMENGSRLLGSLSIRQGPVFSLLWSEAASCGQVVGGWTGRQAVCPVSFGHFCHHLHVVIESDCLDRSWRCPASWRLSALLPAVTSHPPIRDWLWGLHEALRCRQKDLSARYNI